MIGVERRTFLFYMIPESIQIVRSEIKIFFGSDFKFIISYKLFKFLTINPISMAWSQIKLSKNMMTLNIILSTANVHINRP